MILYSFLIICCLTATVVNHEFIDRGESIEETCLACENIAWDIYETLSEIELVWLIAFILITAIERKSPRSQNLRT